MSQVGLDLIDEYLNELTVLQVGMIDELKNRAIENQDKAPSREYIRGFVKACDTIISIINERETKVTEGSST